MEWFTIYTRKEPPCSWCQKAKELLRVYGVDFVEIDINEPGVKDIFKKLGLKTVPQTFKEDHWIGGHDALRSYLNEEQKKQERDYRGKEGSPAEYRSS